MLSIKNLARWTSRDLVRVAAEEQRPQLLTIPYSHYCESAAWALDRAGVDYVEHGFVPGEHVLPALHLRVGGAEKRLSASSRVDAAPRTRADLDGSSIRRRRSNATAVPALCLPDGRVLADSWAIAEAYSGPCVVDGFKELLDDSVGPSAAGVHGERGNGTRSSRERTLVVCRLTRQLIYEVLFRRENAEVWDGLAGVGRGPGFRLSWRLLSPRLTDSMRHLFRTEDAAAMALCRDRLGEALDGVSAALDARSGPYLGGEEPSAARAPGRRASDET